MILLNGKLSAVAAQQLGLVSEVLESTDFSEQVVANVQRLLSVSLQVCIIFITISIGITFSISITIIIIYM